MKSIYRKIVLLSVTVFATLMTSCTDFLTIIPPDKIVHEQFWQTKDDVNGMLATSYLKLATTDAVSKAIVWGSLRADDLTFESGKQKDDIRYIVEANINEENSYTKWGVFYEAINYANLVIEYAPLVVGRDPDFLEGDLDVVVGEMYAMRALCHFYLLRTFRDIPMALVPAINDSELPAYEQVHPLEALDLIMKDLDVAEKLVMPSGNYSDPRNNYGRITKNAVLAMKADVNLWRAAFTVWCSKSSDEKYNKHQLVNANIQTYYTDCIANCQAVLDNIDNIYKNNNKFGVTDKKEDLPYHLISNHDEYAIKNETFVSRSYDEIFGYENSSESIFELQIDTKLCQGHSQGITSMFGHKDGAGHLEVPKSFMNKYEKDDLRKYSYTNYPYVKDAAEPAKLTVAKYISKQSPTSSTLRVQKEIDANWIVYRQTDVMLMMAEALVAQPSVSSSDINKAFEFVNVINTRARVDTTNIKNPLKLPADAESALELVLEERARELAFEGKRWYDLVRKALRENTTENIKFVADKLTSNATSLKNKMLDIDNLFLPIHIDELRFNKNLVQNKAYDTDEKTIGMAK